MQSLPEDEWTGVYTPRIWTRYRRRAVDRRTRGYKQWAARRARLVESLGHTPTAAEDALLDQLADRLVAADVQRAQRYNGIGHNENDARAAAGEVRRLMKMLKLVDKSGDESGKSLEDVLR